jgi:hypothetical protein
VLNKRSLRIEEKKRKGKGKEHELYSKNPEILSREEIEYSLVTAGFDQRDPEM